MRRQRKILILANGANSLYGFRYEFIEALMNKGYDVYFSVPEEADDDYVRLLKQIGAIHLQTPMNRRGINPFEDFKLFQQYKKIIRHLTPDLILTYTIKPNIYGTFAARLCKRDVIVTITGIGSSLTYSKLKYFIRFLYKLACEKANYIVFQNESNHSLFIQHHLVDKQKTMIVPGSGVNINRFTPAKVERNDSVIRFLYIGRIMKEKGIEEYVEAAKNVKLFYPNTEFQIIGAFEEEKYRTFIHTNPHVTYLGISKDVRHEIKQADCIVLPSYHEGMSNALLEAAAMEKPLLASNIPGCKEIIEDGYNGYLFKVKSVESLKEKLIQFMELEKLEREQMGKNSRKKVEAHFDRKIVITKYLKIIHEMLTKGGEYIETL